MRNVVPPPVVGNAAFAFVADTDGNSISVFQVDEVAGKLAPVLGSPFPAGGNGPEFIAVDPAHKFLFAGNSRGNSVSAFQIDLTSGNLTPVAGSPFTSGNGPEGVAVDPQGRFVFVSNQAANSISVFALAANGSLTPVAGSPFAAKSPFGLAVNPAGTILYANNFPGSTSSDLNTVTAYQISGSGALTTMPSFVFSTAATSGFASAVGLAMDPAGKLLIVADH